LEASDLIAEDLPGYFNWLHEHTMSLDSGGGLAVIMMDGWPEVAKLVGRLLALSRSFDVCDVSGL
jgi:hypothetical protein